MRQTKGVSGMLVLKSLGCRITPEPRACLLYEKINPCWFKSLLMPLFPAALGTSDGHTTNLPVIPEFAGLFGCGGEKKSSVESDTHRSPIF